MHDFMQWQCYSTRTILTHDLRVVSLSIEGVLSFNGHPLMVDDWL